MTKTLNESDIEFIANYGPEELTHEDAEALVRLVEWAQGLTQDRTIVKKELKPEIFDVSTLSRLMDDCLPEQIEDERDMQQLIEKLWPALICEQKPNGV